MNVVAGFRGKIDESWEAVAVSGFGWNCHRNAEKLSEDLYRSFATLPGFCQ
jgi:hypothetical protein